MNTQRPISSVQRGADVILMAHGGGGGMTRRLIEDVMVRELGNPILAPLDDGAYLRLSGTDLVMTTDSYVVDPIFFPGGDIGRLAVCGTVNDLAMMGAEPRYLSLALIIEEGLSLADLRRIVRSVGRTAREAGVAIVTGDTKVIGRGRGGRGEAIRTGSDIFINTTGLGTRCRGVDTSVANARPGDAVIVTGAIGDHGIAIMNARDGLQLKSSLKSDVQPLWSLIKPVLKAVPRIHCLRDPTRGGVAGALCDIARSSGRGIRIQEKSLPVRPEVRGSCGILGLDPLNVANEGKALVVCAGSDANRVLKILRGHRAGKRACIIGRVASGHAGLVVMETACGGERLVDVPTGEDLPRIC